LFYSELQITLVCPISGFQTFVTTYNVLHITTTSCICLESGVWWKNPYCTQTKALVSDNKTDHCLLYVPIISMIWLLQGQYKTVQCR